MYVCLYVRTYGCMLSHTMKCSANVLPCVPSTSFDVYVNVCMYVCMYVCACVCVRVYVCVCVYVLLR